MPSRERLLRVAATAAELATAKRVRLVAQLLLAAAIVFAMFRLRSVWGNSHVDWDRVDWAAAIGALFVSLAGVAASAFVWLSILGRLGVETQRRWTGVFFQAQLGKYIPGTVWQYAGRATLARTRGIPLRAVGVSLPIELVALVLGAAAMSPLLLGWWGVLAVGVLVVAGSTAERRLVTRAPAVIATGAHAWLCYLYVWPLIGLGFWLTTRALVTVSIRDLPVYAGAYGVAWLAGFIAVYAPGGLGVREAVLVGLLAGRLGTADALVVATASRLLLTLVDVVLAAAAYAAARRPGPPRGHGWPFHEDRAASRGIAAKPSPTDQR